MARSTRIVKKKKKKATKKDAKSVPAAPKAPKDKLIRMPDLREEMLLVEILGRTPYIQNRLSDEVVDGIEATRMEGGGQSAEAKERPPLDPKAEMLAKLHLIEAAKNGAGLDLKKCKFGIPVAAFKKAIADITYTLTGTFKKNTNAALNIEPDFAGMVALKFKGAPYMRRGVKNRPFLIYYQPVFSPWGCTLRIRYDMSMTTQSSVISMLRHAGAKVGVGNNRPEKGGEFGTFGVGKIQVIKVKN